MSVFTDSQRRAIEANGNVLVVAGAGTGKTHTLVERCLARVCDATQPVSLDRILMVTFTEAAAAEMRKRLRDELEKQAGAHPDNPWLAEQLALVDAARISTLHSFCLQLIREHFHELGLDPQLTVLAEEQARLVARETLNRVLREHYAGGTPAAEAVQQLILEQGRGRDEPIRDLVLRVHHYTQTLRDPESWFREHLAALRQARPGRWEYWLREGFNQWRQTWLPILQSQPEENLNAHRCAECLRQLPAEAAREEIAAALAQILDVDQDWPNQKKGAFREPIEKLFGDAAFLHSVASVREAVDPLAEDLEWVRPQMTALLELAQHFTREFAHAKRELAAVDFHDLEQFALQLLCQRTSGRPGDRARDWRQKLDLVFVDEYQDINEAQDTILRALGRESSRANRFLVGDIKQSIYRFRLADPRIFQRYTEIWNARGFESCKSASPANPPMAPPGRGTTDVRIDSGPPNPPLTPPGRGTCGGVSGSPPPEGLGVGLAAAGQVITLADNFRSHEAILNFVNALFAALMRKEVGGVEYGEEQRLRFGAPAERNYFSLANNTSTRVELHLGLTGGAEAENGEENQNSLADFSDAAREARRAALHLRELRGRFQIWQQATRQFRPADWSDMAILLRSPRNKAETYAKVFEELGVPLTVARGGFFQSPEVSDLLSLLQVLDNPLQDLPLLAVLRAPLVGMTLDELVTIRLAQRRGYVWTALRRFHRDNQPLGSNGRARSHSDHPLPALEGERRQAEGTGQGQGEAASPHARAAWLKVDLFLRRFANWRRLARQSSLSQCLETVLDETCYEAWLQAQSRGQERRANAERLLALTRRFDQFQRQGLFRFLNFVEAQQEADVDSEPASVTAENAVQLMSIHQSKGLEFPVVLVADLGKRFNFDDLKERVILDEEFGLCPKVKPPHADQTYPSLPYWLAQRRQRRELLGEELRLLYVAFTRARDRLILSGMASRKAVEEKWADGATDKFPTHRILEANSYLDWLGAWLPRATGHSDWTMSGQSFLLAWTIYQAGDERLTGRPEPSGQPAESTEPAEAVDSTDWDSLRQRFEWRYPFAAATTEPAKTSVSALRRRLREETEDEANVLFQGSNFKSRAGSRSHGAAARLSAAEVGTAHHLFLQLVHLERVNSRLELMEEANRLSRAAMLSDAELAVLDVDALLAFWQSKLGKRIRAQQTNHIHRELPFTARMSSADLAALKLSVNTGLPDEEFVVVQGFADLAVILPEEIWLVDFKTDHVDNGELEAVVKFYEPQLKLYALALRRIYRRPVTECWLHFLSLKKSVAAGGAD